MKSFFPEKFRMNFFFMVKNNLNPFVTGVSLILFVAILFFILSNFSPVLYNGNLSIFEKGISIILLLSFIYSGLHCVGYMDHLIKSLTLYNDQLIKNDGVNLKTKTPAVAIIIPTLNEDPLMVKETITMAMGVDYENFEVVLIDSSTDNDIRSKTASISSELGIKYIYRDTLRGYKAGSINDAIKNIGSKFEYVLILDSDHRLKSSVLKDLIPVMENNDVTFIQTPQYFEMPVKDRLGLAYSFQQHIFYKHICRGLCVNNTSYICGTNVIIKLEDLKKVGGMDETCITEDISTSFTLHSEGYRSIYIDKVYAEGLAPPSLSAYYGQQLRWAYGTFQNNKRVLKKFLKNPKSMKSLQWWEYLFLNGTWYFIGVAIFIWLSYPVLVLLLNLKPLVLGSLNIPFYIFLVMIISQTLASYRERGYPLKELILAQALFFSLFPVYTKALIYGLMNKKLKFKVTPKKGIHRTDFKEILPQVVVMVLLTLSIIMGLSKLIGGENTTTYPSIILWASYSLIMLSIFMIYFYLEDVNKYKTL
jgi:cellulose synthase (UDP-forming)